jgi:peroxiredoxin
VVPHRLDAGARSELRLLSDWNAEATRAFGIAHRYRHFEDVSQRSAFLIDSGGIVRGAWLYEAAEVPDVDELLAACRALS